MPHRLTLTEDQERLLKSHQDIDLLARTSGLPFISGWETTHEIRYEHLEGVRRPVDPFDYRFMSDDEELKDKIRRFHRRVDGILSSRSDVFLGAGSSPLLSSVMTLLARAGVREVLYAKPIYHTYYFLAQTFGLRFAPIGDALSLPGEEGLADNLPERESVLLITDPSWISGRPLGDDVWRAIGRWQERTGSMVFVDGTFSYTRWDEMAPEAASRLDPERTIRLVCPTKSLCVHGVRFAYLLLPAQLEQELAYCYCKLVAATSAFDISVAHRMMDQLLAPTSNRALTAYLQERYRDLRAAGIILDSLVEPSCTYYTFGRAGYESSSILSMGSSYFELDYPDDYIRINLLSPDLPTPDEAFAVHATAGKRAVS
ncbi:MAG: aminotransferase class I/II-fold pyridoxal phosphate-dependent enzyme [Acidobacteriota bacterium]